MRSEDRTDKAKNHPSHKSMPPAVQFQEIPIGGHFEFRGRRYRKLALNMAGDEERNGAIFMNQTEVGPDSTSRSSSTTPPARPPASNRNSQPTGGT